MTEKTNKIAQPWLRSSHGMSALLIVSGVLTGLSVSFEWLGFLEWISLVPALCVFFHAANDPDVRLRRLYRYGLIFNYSFSIVLFHWFFYMYPLDFVGVTPMAALGIVLFAILGLSLLQTLFAALFPVLLGVICRGRVVKSVPFLQVVVMAGLWCVREWAQTLNWTGVPWGRLALGQAAMPVMLQTARWFGPYVITFVIVLVNGCIAYALLHTNARRLCAVVGLSIFTLQLSLGGILMLSDTSCATDRTCKVAAIQGNIGSADKWQTTAKDSFEIYYHLTEQAATEGADVIVWPETAVPIKLTKYPDYMERLQALAREHEAILLLGVFAPGGELGDYNAIVMIDEMGEVQENFYAKRHLVPFGEYVPLRPLIQVICPPILELSQLANGSAPGESAAVFDTSYGGIGSLICFDSIYEELAYDSARHGAELICISTNDSWFFDSSAVYMHNAQAKLRAIETGRYVVRAANTGVSSVITPTGKEITRLDVLLEGVIMADIEMRSGVTLYTRIGNLFVYLCLGGAVALMGERVWRGVRCRKKEN